MAIAYKNGGDGYLGHLYDKTLDEWKKLGRSLRQKFMYKGYRYLGGTKDTVVVYDTARWSAAERIRRKVNGFLGIKEYKLQKAKK